MSTLIATRSTSQIQHPPGDLALAKSKLDDVAANAGLDADDLLQLISEAPNTEREALRAMLDAEATPVSRKDATNALARLEDVLGTQIGSGSLKGRWNFVGRRAADLLGLFLGPFCGYLVIGGLVEGDSLLLGKSAGPLGLFVFLGLLALLGLYEALHTSATQLKLADLGAIAEQYPRAARLHRRFRTDEGLSRFLAGRQMVVIVTVFFCSPLSSFPSLEHWPLTTAPLPGVVHVLLIVGMPGALFVYWFGQLVPQFLATRHAVGLTNSRIVALAFNGAFALESLGLARPGVWIAALDRRSSTPIPSSAAVRWQQTAQELDGYGVVGIVRDWRIGADGARLQASTNVRMYKCAQSITDASMLVPGAPNELVLKATAKRGPEALPLQATGHREELLPSGERRFHKPLLPAIGSFLERDSIRIAMAANYHGEVGQDLVVVDKPARFVLFRVCTDYLPAAAPPARLRSYRIGDGLADLHELEELLIEPVLEPDGRLRISAVIQFPAPGTLYVLDWEVVI
jgi:hypothetical protein